MPSSFRRSDDPETANPRAATPDATHEASFQERLARARTLARRALGHWRMALLLFLVGTAVAVLVALNVRRVYQSRCVVLLKRGMKADAREDETPAERAQRMAPKLKEVLTTRSHLERIINEFRLYPRTVEARGMVEATDEMRMHVGFRGKESDTFEVSFEDESADVAQSVAERLAETMIEEFTGANLSQTKQQADFLTQEETRAEDELETANEELATFVAAHPEFAAEAKLATGPNTPSAIPSPGVVSGGAPADPQLLTLRRLRARLEAEMQSTTPGAPPAPGTTVAPPRSIEVLTRARDDAAKAAAAAQANLTDKRMHLTDQHPDVVAARVAAESAVRSLARAEAALTDAELQSAHAIAPEPPRAEPSDADGAGIVRRRLADLEAQIAARQQAIAHQTVPQASPGAAGSNDPAGHLVRLETEMQRLVRAMGAARSHLDELQQHAEHATLEASAVAANGGEQMEIIDPAFRPQRPLRGGRTNTALAGAALALVLSALYAAARVVLTDTLIDAKDIEELSVLPVLGVLPRLDGLGALDEGRSL